MERKTTGGFVIKYTNLDRLARRLRGRLKLGTEFPSETEIDNPLNSLLAYNPSASDQVVDTLLIRDVAETTDSYIDLLLSQIYQYPLKLTSDITVSTLASISEGLILSTLIATHFTGTPGIIASDTSNASMDLRRGAEFLLAQILAGTQIYFPSSLQSPNNQVNSPEMQPLRLPGEVLLGQSERPDTITRNYSYTGKRNSNQNAFFSDRCNSCSPRSDGTAMGSTPKRFDLCNPNLPYPDYEVFD